VYHSVAVSPTVARVFLLPPCYPKIMALTALAIRKLKLPAKRRRELFDGLIPGFGVRVTDRGAKSYIFLYVANGRRRRYTIGRVGEIHLEDAREQARELRSLVRQGRDPITEKKAAREATKAAAAHLFREVVEHYDKRDLAGKRSGKDIRRTIDKYLLPHWKDKPVTAITADDVHERVETLLDADKPEAARRLFEIARAFFNWVLAHRTYQLDRSPCEGMRPTKFIGAKPFRTRVLENAELRTLWTAATGAEYPFGPMVHLLILTGLRRNEVAQARWSELDLDRALWVIPAERMKGKAAHAVPLTTEMLTILKALPRTGEFLFSSGRRGDKPVSGFSVMKQRLDRRAGLTGWTLHDIRRTMRTHLSALPVADLVRELVIAHTKPGLHKVYDQHAYLDEKRHVLELWASRLKKIIEGHAASPNVVALRAG